MSMPISKALLIGASLALLSACTSEPVQEQASEGAPIVECAIGPGSDYDPSCLAEIEGQVLIIRHPDGSFRRFDLETFESADGADDARVERQDGEVSIEVAGDRYRFDTGLVSGSVNGLDPS